MCNFRQGYVNVVGICVNSPDTKCIQFGLDGVCLHCNKGYKLNSSTLKCVKFD